MGILMIVHEACPNMQLQYDLDPPWWATPITAQTPVFFILEEVMVGTVLHFNQVEHEVQIDLSSK
jgi:hypothetical protein